MKKIKITALTAVVCGALVINACAPKTTLVDFNNVPDTHHCQFMKEVCKEAEEFDRQYQSMSAEEKQDAKTILNAYVQQCADAQEICKRSAKQ
ncbi:MAG: hypothetical protein LBB56_08455 [Chitinispirillales bacterium]|nr:hypothetical protein [Chitinispirillales bacterium]